jgi:YfiR/HmsC-like
MGSAPRTLLAGLTALALCASGATAQDTSIEYGVKGAYLYKFLPFVGWPAAALSSPNAPLTICILGHDPFGTVLDKAVADQHVEARAIAVRRVEAVDANCQVVFVGITDPQAEGAALQALQGKPVLTVTDSGAPVPGIIAFVIEANHVRFDIDDAAAARNGLTISSKLLSLARAVKPRSGAL